ncbi:MAG: histidine phosphatase family protein [Ferruginibacter sp.]
MKTLFIIRHAKSDQSFLGNDFERPLNERGKSDATMMANRLLDKKIKIDALVSSPAVRAKKTAAAFAEILNIPQDGIILISSLYQAPSQVFYEEIGVLPKNLNSLALFSHNPGITYFVNSLKTKTRIDNMPTCGIFAVSANIELWAEFSKAQKEFLFFDYPKS